MSDHWESQVRHAETYIREDRLVNWETAHGPKVQDIHDGSENHRSGFFPRRFLHTSLHGGRARDDRAGWESVSGVENSLLATKAIVAIRNNNQTSSWIGLLPGSTRYWGTPERSNTRVFWASMPAQ